MNFIKSRISKYLLCILMFLISFYLVGCEPLNSGDTEDMLLNKIDKLFAEIDSKEPNMTIEVLTNSEGSPSNLNVEFDITKIHIKSVSAIYEYYYEILEVGINEYGNYGGWEKTFFNISYDYLIDNEIFIIRWFQKMKSSDFTIIDNTCVLKDEAKEKYDLTYLTIQYDNFVYTINISYENVPMTITISKVGQTKVTLPKVTK